MKVTLPPGFGPKSEPVKPVTPETEASEPEELNLNPTDFRRLQRMLYFLQWEVKVARISLALLCGFGERVTAKPLSRKETHIPFSIANTDTLANALGLTREELLAVGNEPVDQAGEAKLLEAKTRLRSKVNERLSRYGLRLHIQPAPSTTWRPWH